MDHGNDIQEYPRPALTVDCVVFGVDLEERDLRVLLIQRDHPPFKHKWALPGGYVHLEESLEEAARRELAEETNVTDVYLEQLAVFGDVDRDPRGRIVTVAYSALVTLRDYDLRGATDARDAAWFSVDEVEQLAFDHDRILALACARLRQQVLQEPIAFALLPAAFTLTQLQRLYEIILGTTLDKRNFRKKVVSLGLLERLNAVERHVAHRAAWLYRFDQREYQRKKKRGFRFAL